MSTFQFVQPTDEQKQNMQIMRDKYEELKAHILALPDNRGRSIALTKLEESGMWLNKSITNNC